VTVGGTSRNRARGDCAAGAAAVITTICWPIDLLILSAPMRPRASWPPPGGNGMTSVTGREGYAWAAAGPAANDDATAPPRRTINSRGQNHAVQKRSAGFHILSASSSAPVICTAHRHRARLSRGDPLMGVLGPSLLKEGLTYIVPRR
jgi:hypothetical protein